MASYHESMYGFFGLDMQDQPDDSESCNEVDEASDVTVGAKKVEKLALIKQKARERILKDMDQVDL